MGGLYLYEDCSDGRYYLGNSARNDSRQIRRVYGVRELKHRVAGKVFSYPPHGFSQVNHSVLDMLINTVHRLLEPHPRDILLDLYCGYGLFSLCFAHEVRRVVGAESSREAVEAGRRNAEFQKVKNVDFVRRRISGETIGALLRRGHKDCCVILDPPRGGTGEGVIERIAAAGVRNVVHLVCAIDLLEREVGCWAAAGYRVGRAVPVDMFPGTDDVELVLQIIPAHQREGKIVGRHFPDVMAEKGMSSRG